MPRAALAGPRRGRRVGEELARVTKRPPPRSRRGLQVYGVSIGSESHESPTRQKPPSTLMTGAGGVVRVSASDGGVTVRPISSGWIQRAQRAATLWQSGGHTASSPPHFVISVAMNAIRALKDGGCRTPRAGRHRGQRAMLNPALGFSPRFGEEVGRHRGNEDDGPWGIAYPAEGGSSRWATRCVRK